MNQSLFQRRTPTQHQQKVMRFGENDAQQLAERLKDVPNSRAKSIFLTNLETTMLWFNKAVMEHFGEESIQPPGDEDGEQPDVNKSA